MPGAPDHPTGPTQDAKLVRVVDGDTIQVRIAATHAVEKVRLLGVDAPDHTRLRKLVAQGFLHKYIQSLAPAIERVVDELLDLIQAPELQPAGAATIAQSVINNGTTGGTMTKVVINVSGDPWADREKDVEAAFARD